VGNQWVGSVKKGGRRERKFIEGKKRGEDYPLVRERKKKRNLLGDEKGASFSR